MGFLVCNLFFKSLNGSPACDSWTQTSWQVMKRDSDTADSDKPRIVLYCVKRSMSKSAAVVPQGWKVHCQCETDQRARVNSLIKTLLCRLRFTQYKNMWLVRKVHADLWENVFSFRLSSDFLVSTKCKTIFAAASFRNSSAQFFKSLRVILTLVSSAMR